MRSLKIEQITEIIITKAKLLGLEIEFKDSRFSGNNTTRKYWINGIKRLSFNFKPNGYLMGNVYIDKFSFEDSKEAVIEKGRENSWGKRIDLNRIDGSTNEQIDYLIYLLNQIPHDTKSSQNIKPSPKNKSYPSMKELKAFLRTNGFRQEVSTIEKMAIDWESSYTSTVRRGEYFHILRENNLLDKFISDYWNEGLTKAGKGRIEHYLNVAQRYRDYSHPSKDAFSALHKAINLDLKLVPKNKPIGKLRPEKIVGTHNQYYRDNSVVAYVLHQAKGKCQFCGTDAPFINSNGKPYLEVHHVIPLSEGGEDTVDNCLALCPNCHREFHFGKNRLTMMEQSKEILNSKK